jgi:hypothetical protein
MHLGLANIIDVSMNGSKTIPVPYLIHHYNFCSTSDIFFVLFWFVYRSSFLSTGGTGTVKCKHLKG